MFTDEAIINFMTELKHAGSELLALTYHLAKNDPGTDDATRELADFTEADFDGYAALSPANNVPSINGDGQGELDGVTLIWTAGSGITSQNLYWIYVTYVGSDSTDKLFFCGKFDTPVTLAIPGQQIKKRVNFFAYNGT